MPKLPEDKVGLYVSISKKLDKKFREFLIEKYGYYRKGLISEEVEQALWNWLALHAHKKHKERGEGVNPEPRYRLVYDEVKQWLIINYGYDPSQLTQIPRRHLVEAISEIRGNDKRTIRKWLKTFTEKGLIKWLSPNLVELVR